MNKKQKSWFFLLFCGLPLKSLRNKHGLSLLELVISAGALGFFILLIQSMLVLGHSLKASQKNLFESFQNARMIKQSICTVNISFKSININPTQSYTTTEENLCKTEDSPSKDLKTCEKQKDDKGRIIKDANGKPQYIRQYSRSYEKLGKKNTAKPIIGLYVADLSSEPNFKKINNISKSSKNTKIDPENVEFNNGGKALYYKVYQDSHTMVRINVDMSAQGETQGEILGSKIKSAYIFASRCLNHTNKEHAAHNKFSTFHPEAKKKSALYILETLKKKPFYFPSTKTGSEAEVIKCCKTEDSGGTAETDTAPKECEPASKQWTPRIYVIYLDKFVPEENKPKPKEGFPMQVRHIQELPEMQDVNTVWGAGFMISMSKKISLSQSSFTLDTMILKNYCSSSITSIQKCTPLSFGTDPFTQSLVGAGGINMTRFIRPDVSSCSGYSTGVDTTGIIRL